MHEPQRPTVRLAPLRHEPGMTVDVGSGVYLRGSAAAVAPARDALLLIARSRAHLARLARESGHCAVLGMADGGEVVCLAATGTPADRTMERGARLPLQASALGLVLAAQDPTAVAGGAPVEEEGAALVHQPGSWSLAVRLPLESIPCAVGIAGRRQPPADEVRARHVVALRATASSISAHDGRS